jgi:hypothetical protein
MSLKLSSISLVFEEESFAWMLELLKSEES